MPDWLQDHRRIGFGASVVVKYSFAARPVAQVTSAILGESMFYTITSWLKSRSLLMVLPLFVLSSCKSTTSAVRAQEPIKGFMIDAARTVEQMDHYFRFIDFCSEWGFNTLIFRLTDDEGSAYRFQSHPELKTQGGALTRSELGALVDFASERGIVLIPEVESFGHTKYITDVEQYESLRDVGDPSIEWANGICPVNDTTFSLLVDLYDEVADVFPSEFMHIGCDETNWGGNPLTQEALKTRSKNEIWSEYVNRLHHYVRSKGKRTIIWGDVPIREENEILDRLDKDIVIMDWNYTVTSVDTVIANARLVLDKGFELIGAPAANWFMWGPRVGQIQLDNMAAFVSAYEKLEDPNILGIAITHWVPSRYTQDSQWDTYALAGSKLNRPADDMEAVLSSFVSRHFGAAWDGNWDRLFSQMYRYAPTYSDLQSVPPDVQGSSMSPWKSDAELLALLDRPDTTANRFTEVADLLRQLRPTVTDNQEDFEDYVLTADCIRHFVWRENAIIKLKWEPDLTGSGLQAVISEIAARDMELRQRLEASWSNGRKGAMPDAHMWDFPAAAAYARSLADSPRDLAVLLNEVLRRRDSAG